MFFKNAHFPNPEDRHLLCELREMIGQLRMRMSVGSSCEGNTFPDAKFYYSVCRIKFVYRLAPSGGGKLDREAARFNKIQRLVYDGADLCAGPVAMDLDKIDMRKTIDQSRRRNFAYATKIISIECIDIFVLELRGAGWNAIEHLIGAIKEMDRAQNKIELIPMSLNPFAPSC